MSVAHRTGTCTSADVTLSYRRLSLGSESLGSESLGSEYFYSDPFYSDPNVVFVHGLSYFSYDWLEVAAALASDRECVAMDMRGFGDSAWSAAKDYSVPTMARDIANLLDHLGWKRAVLVARSMGARNAAYLAATEPQRIAALILVDYSPENAPAGSRRVAQTVARAPDLFPTIEDAMRHFNARAAQRERFEAYLRPVPGGYAIKRDPYFRDQFRRALETGERPRLGVDMWQILAAITCPTLVLRGSRSDLFAAETVAKLRAANPRFTVIEVDAPHNVHGENPDGFLAAVKPFLASLKETRHEQTA